MYRVYPLHKHHKGVQSGSTGKVADLADTANVVDSSDPLLRGTLSTCEMVKCSLWTITSHQPSGPPPTLPVCECGGGGSQRIVNRMWGLALSQRGQYMGCGGVWPSIIGSKACGMWVVCVGAWPSYSDGVGVWVLSLSS
jgi:hypothetical protein